MDACFISSNSFTTTSEKHISLFGLRNRTSSRRKSIVQFHLFKNVGFPLSVKCMCSVFHLNLIFSQPKHLLLKLSRPGGSSSNSPQDEERPFVDADWRSFRARLVAGEKTFRSEEPSSVVNPDTTDDLPPPPPAVKIGDKWAHPIHEPEKACLLIATDKLDGVHIFERTVILMLSVGPIGPRGIILNRPSLMSIKEMRSSALDVAGTFANRPLFFGGPLEEGLFLVSPNEGDDGLAGSGVFDEVVKGLYYGTKESVGCAAEMVKRDVVGVDNFRFFDGYCAWERDQLKDEIKAGYWTVAACSPSVIGLSNVGSVGLWEEILGLMGPKKVW